MRKSRQELLIQASEKYKNLQFRDDFLFCKILGNNPEIARELLELILNVKIRKVVTALKAVKKGSLKAVKIS